MGENLNGTQLEARRLELRRGWFFHFPSDDEVEIRASQLGKPHFRIKDKSMGGWLREALSKLDGAHPIAEILSSVPERERQSLERIISALQRKFLYERSERSANQLPNWLAHTLGQRDTAYQLYADAVTRAKLVVIGAGRLGKTIADYLSDFGAERVTLWDPKRTRSASDSSIPPSERESEAVEEVEIETLRSRLTETGADLVIVALDYFAPSIARIVNQTCLDNGTRWVFCLVDGWNLYAGPCFVPHESGCFECFLRAKFPDAIGSIDDVESHESFVSQVGPLLNPAFGGLLAGLVVADVPNLLGKVPYALERSQSLLLGAHVAIDLRTYEVNLARAARLTDCAACAT